MGWVRVVDNWFTHAKFLGIGAEPVALWLALLGWSNSQQRDGVIPRAVVDHVARLVDLRDPATALGTLARRELVRCDDENVVIEHYLEHQRSRAEITAVRRANVQYNRRYRQRQREKLTRAPVKPSRASSSSSFSSSSSTRKKTGRSILPTPFPLTNEMVAYARKQGCRNPSVAWENFCDYWRGQGTMRADWVATWRVWIRRHLNCPCEKSPERKYYVAPKEAQMRTPRGASPGPERVSHEIARAVIPGLEERDERAKGPRPF